MSSVTEDKISLFKYYFTKEGVHPYEEVKWKSFDAVIKDYQTDKIKFEQKNVLFPDFYSQAAVNIIASKYFRGVQGTDGRESSYKELLDRVVKTNIAWGVEQGYFQTEDEAKIFSNELTYILLHQMAYFNSPVWFNMGFPGRPQTSSACFINSIEDTMDSILDLVKTEGTIFKAGSGSGVNISNLRSKHEHLSSGGTSSGAVSFMRGFDKFAGLIKSAGATRRAAKMVIMNIDHPEIEDFIQCKVKEEEKAFALIREGYESSYNGEAYSTIDFQNANNSVRVQDEFMENVENDDYFWTKFINGKKFKKYKAKNIFHQISEAAWKSGDPGIQFDSIINKWNTCKKEKCNASNPCAEYLAQDDTACNLASLNLMKFFDFEKGIFNVDDFIVACSVIYIAQDIWIDKADYPTEKINKKTKVYRTTGLGYANLGSLIMALGLPYDSDEGRSLAASIASIMTAVCYYNSAKLCEKGKLLQFTGFKDNKDTMLEVLEMHKDHTKKIKKNDINKDIIKKAITYWEDSIKTGTNTGYRNSFVTVIAPTGTIGLAMDCDTTGIEPELALVKTKLLAGSDVNIKFVNKTVPLALKRLGYSEEQIKKIEKFIEENGHIEGSPELKEDHYPVFDCSFKTKERFINHMGHLKMLAATQPFISGAASKTINMPESATVEDIMDAYLKAWKMGIKCVAIYRDNSKGSQVLSTIKKERSRATRIKLPDDVNTKRHRFSVGEHKGYIQTGLYEDGLPGEIFIIMNQTGSTIRGLMDSIGILISLLLQYGVPVKAIVKKLLHTKFEPQGFTTNNKIRFASSVLDYLAKYLAATFMNNEDKESINYEDLYHENSIEENKPIIVKDNASKSTGEFCLSCGSMMVRNGNCKLCPNCGSTSGCS